MNKNTVLILLGIGIFVGIIIVTIIVGFAVGLNLSKGNDLFNFNESNTSDSTSSKSATEKVKEDEEKSGEVTEEEIIINDSLKLNKKFDIFKNLVTWKIEEMSINEETDEYVINVKYPKLVNYYDANVQDNFNNIVKNYVDSKIIEISSLPKVSDIKNYINMDFDIDNINSNYISILVTGESYYGGAHSVPIVHTYNYDLQNMEEMNLSDLFISGSDYLNELSSISDLKLTALLGDGYWGSGAESNAENFQNFTFNDSRLRIKFDAYQVGPYAVGTPEVEIDFSELNGIIEGI